MADGMGTQQAAWDQLWGQADLGQEHPPHLPQQMQRRLRSRLTSDVFGPGLKTSVDVLLPVTNMLGCVANKTGGRNSTKTLNTDTATELSKKKV